MLPIANRRSIKNLLAVSVVGLSALFTFVAVFDVSSAQADRHDHALPAAIGTSPTQVDHHEHSQPASAVNSSLEQVVQNQISRPTSASTIADVSIVDFAFDPQIITITVGSSVRWTRSPTSNFTHTTTSDVGSLDPWNSGDLAPGDSFTKVFNTPGTYIYHCEHHPFMTGAVVVLAPSSEPPAVVSIDGPIEGAIDTAYTFTATVSPITATLPITYSWQADGQSPITHIGGDLSDTVVFTWTLGTTGTQLITATATNEGGTAIGTHYIIFNAVRVYLPLIMR
ncbi:MAG TPA: plastocyanin/azurin family copper-binding protein [Anaerolineae bacterium]|nr:plastocyanin/azurin family copper-binding protein [Anaerolineae bacterium]